MPQFANSLLNLFRQWPAILIFLLTLLVSPSVQAQQDTAQQYEQATIELRDAIKEARRTGAYYFHSPASESDAWKEKWNEAGKRAEQAATKLQDAAIKLLFEQSSPDQDIKKIAIQAYQESTESANYDTAYSLIHRLIELEPKQPVWEFEHARMSVLTNRFEQAVSIVNTPQDHIRSLSSFEKSLFDSLDQLIEQYQRELELQQLESEADDLPQVELNTTKGKIILELFEDQAPQAVSQFVFLVENRLYDDLYFHYVVAGMAAQSGLLGTDGMRQATYKIEDERNRQQARQHFRGTLSLFHPPEQSDSAGMQFYINCIPAPQLNGAHTVLGRVISGMEIVDSLTATITLDENGQGKRIEDTTPDRIIHARVIRKRDHKYEPERMMPDDSKLESNQPTSDN